MQVGYSRDFPGLGKRIKFFRMQSDKSITKLAAAADISVTHWIRIENEMVRSLPLETLRGIESALGIDLEISFDG